ncbi:hypothetical protein GSI_12137 [Ganoderma sinense ZZ0214-1]|uniref:Uncharacterized protein n=1 Tax=Ganoderma sinense ZZ0214-1 TaxID=1077348 RepID=A0A2G8RXY9_9APHY|nr:hypothetical protein GSI_12137 [Ganoderma sinense ZZ0214-1]
MTRKEADIDTGQSGSDSWGQRIRTLYYIAVSNFVFPILFNITEIAIIFYDPNFFHGTTVVTVNCYVTIIGVILATIWAQGSKRGKPHARRSRGRRTTTVLGSLQFASRHVESQMPDGHESDDDEHAFEDPPPQRAKPTRGQATMCERGEAPTGVTTPNGRSVVFQGVGGSTVVTQGTIYEETEPREKQVPEYSSSSGSTAPELASPKSERLQIDNAEASDVNEKRARSVPGSPTSVRG